MEIPPDRGVPKIITFFSSSGFQVIFTLLALGLAIYYNFAYYRYVPFTGVWLDYQDQGRNSALISSLDPDGPGEKAGLRVGDKIVTIDGRAITNLNVPVHKAKKSGEIEKYVVERAQETLTIPVRVGSFRDHLDHLGDIVPVQLLSLLICLLGILLLFFSPKTNIRGRLIAIAWVLAGVALAATGPGYSGCAWFAPEIAMLTFAFGIFVVPAAHLYFPVPSFSNRTRNSILWVLFVLAILLATVYLAEQISLALRHQNPATTLTFKMISYLFYLSLLLSLGLLLKNRFFIQDRDIKRQTSIIFLGTLLGILPFLLFSGLPTLIYGRGSEFILLPSNISILPLIFIPISYGYVVYQRKLLKIDLIINRALVLFLLILTTLFLSFTVLAVISNFLPLPTQLAVAGSILCVCVALPSAALKKRIQVQVDRVLYGGYYDYTTVTSDLSDRLAQTLDRSAYIKLLTNELPEKMKITRSSLLLASDGVLEITESDELAFSVPLSDEICKKLLNTACPILTQNLWDLTTREAFERWQLFSWAQLFVPIVHRDTLYGVLILGDRSTGDIYSNQDLQIIGTVGQQAALSIANIMLVETLRGLAQQMVRSDEEQRKKVARDLHDSVLQNLFFVKQRLARSDPEAASFVDHTIMMLRQTIKTQRSSFLDRGLILAIQDLINHMEQLAEDDTVILWHNHLEEEVRLSDEQATSIYRIVQESLSNVLKHAQAEQAVVSARKEHGFLEIQIEDDGIGMAGKNQVQMGHHYGLLGMRERATMIGAEMSIASVPGNGTTVKVRLRL